MLYFTITANNWVFFMFSFPEPTRGRHQGPAGGPPRVRAVEPQPEPGRSLNLSQGGVAAAAALGALSALPPGPRRGTRPTVGRRPALARGPCPTAEDGLHRDRHPGAAREAADQAAAESRECAGPAVAAATTAAAAAAAAVGTGAGGRSR